MAGDDRVRFCAECKKHVYNLSAMNRREAEVLLVKSEGGICTRFYRRPDGTMLTEDCPVGLRAKAVLLKRRLSFAMSGILSVAGAFAQAPSKPDQLVQVETDARAELAGVVLDQGGYPLARTHLTLADKSQENPSRRPPTREESINSAGSNGARTR